MGTILESTKELAKRFGVENEEQTIKDQIDAITESIDQNFNGSVDIASAVSEFAKNDNPDARLGTKTITENDTYIALDDELDGYSSVTVNVATPTPETFEVTLACDSETQSFTTDKSYDDVKAAIQANKTINFIWSMQYQGEIAASGTSTAVSYDAEGDFMTIVDSLVVEGSSGCFMFLWGNPEAYTTVSTVGTPLFDYLK